MWLFTAAQLMNSSSLGCSSESGGKARKVGGRSDSNPACSEGITATWSSSGRCFSLSHAVVSVLLAEEWKKNSPVPLLS